MKPSFTNQKQVPATDRKFRPTDEHLIAEDKEEVNKINHGDKMEALESHDHDNHAKKDGPELDRS